jgi:hypothetical protein
MVGATTVLARSGLHWRVVWQRDLVNERLVILEIVTEPSREAAP